MLANFNKAMEYIETHLEEEIDFNMVSKIAGVSEYHFRKMFSYISGMTLSSYIRKRKLSKASFDLIISSILFSLNYKRFPNIVSPGMILQVF